MSDSNIVAVGVIWYVVFLFSTVLHEAAHALVARLGGDRTADDQVTIDPTPHLQREPVGMILVPILSYSANQWMMGWASTPYDPSWARTHPHRAARMALAGPAANLLLAVIAAVLIKLGIAYGWFTAPSQVTTRDMHRLIVGAAAGAQYEPACMVVPAVPTDLARIIDMALAPAPNRRVASARELASLIAPFAGIEFGASAISGAVPSSPPAAETRRSRGIARLERVVMGQSPETQKRVSIRPNLVLVSSAAKSDHIKRSPTLSRSWMRPCSPSLPTAHAL